MNREIKFRVWDERFNCYIKDKSLVRINASDGKVNSIYNPKSVPWQLEQYKGEKDIKEIEIYENDLVKAHVMCLGQTIEDGYTGVVTFLEGSWMVVNKEQNKAYLLWSETLEWEVIGNVHDI